MTRGLDVRMFSGGCQARPGPGQQGHLNLGSQLRRAPKVLGPQGHTGLCWTERKQVEMGCVAERSFSFLVSISLHPICKLCSPEPARSLPIKPKDASLAPPSGKTEASMQMASGPLLGEGKEAKVLLTYPPAGHREGEKNTPLEPSLRNCSNWEHLHSMPR